VTREHLPHAVRAAHRDGIVAYVLAVLVALFFPVAASAGTETHVLRYATAAVLALAGVMLRRGGSRPALLAGALGLLVVAAFPLNALWLAGFAVLCAMDAGVARLRDAAAARRAVPPAVPDTPEDGEAPSDIIESVAIAFVYALVVREFSCEAFKIPTESMFPTILGNAHNSRIGDQLLAAKAPLLFGEPKRWSIVVFRYPLFRPTNYIKRLVGMSGELIENRGGDIYANGRIVSKPDEVQETLWFPLLPDGDGDWPAGGTAQVFRAEGGGDCRFESEGAMLTADADKTSWIAHDNGCPDVRASFDADASGLSDSGAVIVRLDGAGRRVEFEARRDGVWLTAPGVDRTKLDVAGLGASPARFAFSVADRVVRVWRDGRLAARVETADQPNLTGRRDQTWFGVRGGTAHVAHVRIERDLQYTQKGPDKWQVPVGCYFMLGDNTGASRDSREWEGFVFRTKDGREFVCDSYGVRLDDGPETSPSVRPTPDGNAFEIWDSYGAHRILPKSDLVDGTYRREPQPFVRREDLVGRAFFIFFPLRSEGNWRPRILP
jgi:signal peptidase I